MAVMNYRTQDGFADYGFSIEFEVKIGWRVYIVFRPFYRDSHGSLQSPYQGIDPDGRCYVDWPSKLESLGDARTVAALWAELIHRYERAQGITTKTVKDWSAMRGSRHTA